MLTMVVREAGAGEKKKVCWYGGVLERGLLRGKERMQRRK